LQRTGLNSTSSWPSGAIAQVTTLRNRNPNRNCLFGWSAEASPVENICGGALKLRAILKFRFSTLWSHRGGRPLWRRSPS
jgi:hypothetical protein